MGEKSKIEWTHHTWNPWWGCTKISAGCARCYAATLGHRYGVEWGKGQARRRASVKVWGDPLRWDRAAKRDGTRYRVFLGSMMDWADAEVPNQWRDLMWETVRVCQNLDFQMLTKREDFAGRMPKDFSVTTYPNVWLGVSAENQEMLVRRAAALAKVHPGVTRFLSCEPLLGPLDLSVALPGSRPGRWLVDHVDWVIVGGESGPGARPFQTGWASRIVQQCAQARVRCFVKQLGAKPHDLAGIPVQLKDPKGGNWSEWPTGLRVREFPEAK